MTVTHRTDGVLRPEQLEKLAPTAERLARGPVAVIECVERIPCNPCVGACPKGAITIEGGMNETPAIDVDICDGCGLCLSACPGLAIFAVDASREGDAGLVSLPYEFRPLPSVGDAVVALDRSGGDVCDAVVVRVLDSKAFDRTPIVTLEVPKDLVMSVRHFRRR